MVLLFILWTTQKCRGVAPGKIHSFPPRFTSVHFIQRYASFLKEISRARINFKTLQKPYFIQGPNLRPFFIRTETQIFLNQMLENHYLDRSGLSYIGMIPIKIDQCFKCTLQTHVVRYVATKLHWLQAVCSGNFNSMLIWSIQ